MIANCLTWIFFALILLVIAGAVFVVAAIFIAIFYIISVFFSFILSFFD